MTTTRIAGITVEQHDRTRTFLLLHGGAGAATVRPFAALLAERARARVLTPTHPGFDGAERPAALATTRDLAAAYTDLLDRLDLTGVTVVGNSFGGWLAAEIALLGSHRVTGAVIVDGIGIEVDGHPLTDVRGLTPDELRALSFHDPAKAPRPQATGPQAADPQTAGAPGPSPDVRALLAYAGPTMSDPTLLTRLAATTTPVHVVWGASDGIVDVEYGKAYAAAIPGARFTVLPESGHLPQVETPEALLGALLGG
ncbi:MULTISPECIES: alpha/beta fold hydrolase [Actinosynnema]|uniref:alpha/beta fold hydrolase n=1 Tax=Actinosynnema TaxID=40566 RepID=UPI0020A28C27|nr:alpha/beta hydrolase [Actinosynnema pretiosum]MCP2094622.1 Pimeloyl-ACP methyl ester carboxylesterase [Actinosynnema pretiosum]